MAARKTSAPGLGGGQLALIAGILAAAVGGSGFLFSGGIPGLPGGASESGAAAVSRDLADGQNITIVSGDGSPITLHIYSEPTEPAAGVTEPDEPEPADDAPGMSFTSGDVAEAAPESEPEPEPPGNALEIAKEKIKQYEGYETEPYDLHGYIHVCFGHVFQADETVESKTLDECLNLLDEDAALAEMVAIEYAAGVWDTMPPPRQAVLIELGYVLGWSGLFGFENMRLAIQRGDWVAAAVDMSDSRLAEQVGETRMSDWRGRFLN